MAYVITTLCVGAKSQACLPVCPMDCIHEGEKQFYINPAECIDCQACASACPVGAIFWDQEVPEKHRASIQENADFYR
jgi:ferredoxin